MDDRSVPEPLEHSVVELPNEVGNSSLDIVTVLEPIEHSVVVKGPHGMGSSSEDSVTVLDLIEHSGAREIADPPSTGQPMLNSEVSRNWEVGRQDLMCDVITPQNVRTDDQRLSPEEEEAIVVGAVGSAAPWFLTGWADEVEIEFMIDTGCQVTILASSVFERMCASEPQVRARLPPCERQLVSADSSPLSVKGEIIAPVSVRSSSGIRLGSCSLVEPSGGVTEDHGVVVGRTLVDASSWSAGVLMVNPNSEEIVLPSFTFAGNLVPVSAVSVALADPGLPGEGCETLPEHLDNIVMGSHPSLGESGRGLLRNLLHRYEHVFPAPGEAVTGRTTSVQHEILNSDVRPVRCGPRRLAPAGLCTEQTCVKDMLLGGQIEPSDSFWVFPVVLVTKKDGSTCFCVDYHRLNSLRMPIRYHALMTRYGCWAISSGSLLWT